MRPDESEYSSFFAGYIRLVPEDDILDVLQSQCESVTCYWRSTPESAAELVHPPFSWSVRQVLIHLVDGERIFGYRLLRIARGDKTPLPGFDEHFFADASEEQPWQLSDIVDSFEMLRRANMLLIKNLPAAAWDRSGIVSGANITSRALAWIIAGHVRHHDAILRKRLS